MVSNNEDDRRMGNWKGFERKQKWPNQANIPALAERP
jgi:hypothetical protein